MSSFLIKTAQGIGSVAAASHNAFFKAEPLYTTEPVHNTSRSSFLPSVRPELKIFLAAYVIASVFTAIYLVNQVVDSEYKGSSLSKRIQQEEATMANLTAEYASLVSSRALSDAIEKNASHTFVGIDTIRYVSATPIVQANALLR